MKIPAFFKNPDVLGWLIWLAVAAVLVGPCIMIFYYITYDTATTLTRIMAGVFAAAILSGVITWLGNEAWFRLRRRGYLERRKAARKGKKKRGGKAR